MSYSLAACHIAESGFQEPVKVHARFRGNTKFRIRHEECGHGPVLSLKVGIMHLLSDTGHGPNFKTK
jgi:hypothetical protein